MKIRSRYLTKLIAYIATSCVRVLFYTYRISVYEVSPKTSPYAETNEASYLYHVWHDQILPATFAGKQRKVAALTSQHRDGDYVSTLLEAAGIKPIRGSSNKGGASATKAMLNLVADHHIVITPDGPRGPRHVCKHGIIFIASISGRKIIPTGFAAKRAWRPWAKWTDLLIPKPFTRLVCVCGDPICIPDKLSDADYENTARYLENSCAHAELDAKRILAGEIQQPTAYKKIDTQQAENFAA